MDSDMKQKYNLMKQIRSKEKKKQFQTDHKTNAFVYTKRQTNLHQSDQQKQKYKLSKIQTNTNANSNYSRNQASNLSLKSPINLNKRIKTQTKSKLLSASNQNAKIKTITKRLKTDVTQRYQSPVLAQQRFQDDHYNTASLAELLQFHTGYNEIDQAQFNYRVRKETQGSKMQEKSEEEKQQKQQKQQKSEKSEKNSETDQQGSVIKVNIEDDNQVEDEQENIHSKESLKKIRESSEKKQKQKIGQQDQKSQKDSIFVSHYTLGATLGHLSQSCQKKKQCSIKKGPKIRSFSLEQKLKIISQNKYIPRTEEEIRMEARYLKSQINDLNLYKQTEEMVKYLSQYQKSKKFLLQQAARKYQISRMMENHKKQNKKLKEIGIKKSVSLPKIKPVHQFVIPEPQQEQKDVEKNQDMINIARCNNKLEKTEHSLSVSRLHYKMSKQKSQKAINKMKEAKDAIRIQTENVEYIENVLRKKGIQFDGSTLRKGLINLRPMANNTESDMRFEVPKNLISNPKYQKYPL